MMTAEELDLIDMVGREPDERLLADELGELLGTDPRPPPPPPSPARARLVGLGVTMTATTLLGGPVLAIGAAVAGLADGFSALLIVVLIVGILLAATHWGWVHVAEMLGQSIEDRQGASALEVRRQWLASVQPRPRWSVATHPGPDGSIAIETLLLRPVPAGPGRFTFTNQVVGREVHPPDEPAAVIAERAEALRQRAAADTERERRRYDRVRDEMTRGRLGQEDDRERLTAARATSQALSEQINRHLRDPPLSQ
jgi:hypothetical protein